MSQKIQVAVRMRPPRAGETYDSAIHIHDHSQPRASASSCVILKREGRSDPTEFKFSHCFNENATQEYIFDKMIEPHIPCVFQGMNVTVLAYGATSSGKTHTISGPTQDPGILPRLIRNLLSFKTPKHISSPIIKFSCMEVYKEDIYDLLQAMDSKKSRKPLKLQDAGETEVSVQGLRHVLVESEAKFSQIYRDIMKRRSVGSTKLNDVSSRSHAIVTFDIAVTDSVSNQRLVGSFRVVDLAGSENNKHTGNSETGRMAESSAINKSLSTLSRVVKAINDRAVLIPYRDSKLTRVLRNSFGGDAVCLLICNIAPLSQFRSDVYNTLQFAKSCQKVQNKPTAHVQEISISGVALQGDEVDSDGPKMLALEDGTKFEIISQQEFDRRIAALAEQQAKLIVAATLAAKELEKQPIAVKHEPKDANFPSNIPEARSPTCLFEQEKENQPTRPIIVKTELEDDRVVVSGTTTPPLRAEALDKNQDLRQQLEQLERTIHHQSNDAPIAEILSPSSSKRMARAYVLLARTHSDKGDLPTSLEYYRKAERCVPHNTKLRDRIIELEYSIKNKISFKPSPSKPQRSRHSHATGSTDLGPAHGKKRSGHTRGQVKSVRQAESSKLLKGRGDSLVSPTKPLKRELSVDEVACLVSTNDPHGPPAAPRKRRRTKQ